MVAVFCGAMLGCSVFCAHGKSAEKPASGKGMRSELRLHLPHLATSDQSVNEAFRTAMGDLLGNVMPMHRGLLEERSRVIFAGLHYNSPWARDASVNASNGTGLILPEETRNSLLAVVRETDRGPMVHHHQYWDLVVWVTGAWDYYLHSGDRAFLKTALPVVRTTLAFFEETEFDAETGLFRGPGWSDGVAAYPDHYANFGGSGIEAWSEHNPDKVSRPGRGIPMKALSTNCLYANAYVRAAKMARALNEPGEQEFAEKAEALKQAINRQLWDGEKGHYRFFTCPMGDCDRQESLGHGYAVLFGIANQTQAASIFRTQKVMPAGVPSVWPDYERYRSKGEMAYSRHAGTVWPQIQGIWADAAARHGRTKIFAHEFFNLTKHAVRDRQFAELYHPVTGEIYGGLQENNWPGRPQGIIEWDSQPRQTWAATGYLRMVFMGLLGMRFDETGVTFAPCVPPELDRIELEGLRYRDMTLAVFIQGGGTRISKFLVNGEARESARIEASA
jgi:glycogen debranching enzyme